MRSTDADVRVERVAAGQYGAFSRRQAIDCGATPGLIQRRLAAHDWVRVASSVYVLATSAGTWVRQCKIAELSVDGSAVARHAAAALHRLDGFRPGPIALIVPEGASRRHPFASCHAYAGADTTEVRGIRVTTIAQSCFDLAALVTPWRLERAIDGCLLERRLTVDDLAARLSFYAGTRRRGLGVIAPLIDERRAEGWIPPESELEALLLGMLHRLRPAPLIVRQATFPWRAPAPGRVDVLLPEHRLVIEADGRRWHARVNDFDRDRWRDNEAVAHGFSVQRFTWVHLHHLADECIGLLERTLRRGAA